MYEGEFHARGGGYATFMWQERAQTRTKRMAHAFPQTPFSAVSKSRLIAPSLHHLLVINVPSIWAPPKKDSRGNKSGFCKRAVLENVPSFWFLYRTLVPVFGTVVPFFVPFGNHPCANPRKMPDASFFGC